MSNFRNLKLLNQLTRYFSFSFLILYGLSSHALTFTSSNVTLNKTTYLPGESVTFQMKLSSDAATASYIIQNAIVDPSGNISIRPFSYAVKISSNEKTTHTFNWTVPQNSAPGVYKYGLVVMNSGWKWLSPRFTQSVTVSKPLEFKTTFSPLSKASYAIGETINFKSSVISNVHSGQNHFLYHKILDSQEREIAILKTDRSYYPSSSAPWISNLSFKIPSTLSPGTYRYRVAGTTNQWVKIPMINGDQSFKVVATSQVPVFNLTNTGPSKEILNRGETVVFADVIKSNIATNAKFNITARVQDLYGLVLKDFNFTNIVIPTSGFTLNVTYTLPTTMQIGSHTIKYFVKSSDNKNSFTVNQTDASLSIFTVETYMTDLKSRPAPDSLVLLKPKNLNSNPLNGSGFLPDTNDTYTLVFSDEFNGTQLDTSKWWTRYIYNNGMQNKLNNECQRYSENNTHPIVNGVLKLTAKPRPGTLCPNPKNDSRFTLWDSGMIRSKTTVKYGYFEARVKLPRGSGVWPAFWLNAEHLGWPPEIDIMEYVINGKTEFHNMLHTGVVERDYVNRPQGAELLYSAPTYNKDWKFTRAPAAVKMHALNDDFHVISGFWNEDGTYATYLDGNPIAYWKYGWKNKDGIDAPNAHVLLNLAMGDGWGTAEWQMPMTTSQQQFEIDYVRVYQKSTKIRKATSTMGRDLCPSAGGC